MRLFVFLLLLPGLAGWLSAADNSAPRPATGDEVALFKDALKNSAQDEDHWAYTETMVARDKRGKVINETVVRFDPSRPYAEQFTPVQVDGQPPAKKHLKKYRKQGEERGKNRARAAERKDGPKSPQFQINNGKAAMDIDHPLVVSAAADATVFEIPLISKDGSLPVEKLRILAQVDPRSRLITQARLLVRDPFRVKLVAKVRRGAATVDLAVVNPEFAPVVTGMHGNLGASLLLIPFEVTFVATRTGFERVKAYDERFGVKLAPLELLGF
jgi:hypothetical protein